MKLPEVKLPDLKSLTEKAIPTKQLENTLNKTIETIERTVEQIKERPNPPNRISATINLGIIQFQLEYDIEKKDDKE